MHGRFWMNTWSKEINLDDYAECKEFRIHYYTRRMNGGYNSHLFLVNWDSEEQLLKGWNQIDSFVAVNIQSQTELLIERSNFYIIHFVPKSMFMIIFKRTCMLSVIMLRKKYFILQYQKSQNTKIKKCG